jgi:hypothetical protein
MVSDVASFYQVSKLKKSFWNDLKKNEPSLVHIHRKRQREWTGPI